MTRGPRKGTGGRPPATDRATVRTTRVETLVNADEIAAMERHRRQGETRGALVRRLALVGVETLDNMRRFTGGEEE